MEKSFESKNETKSLAEQMLEHFERKEKIEQLKKELLVNPPWNIYYDEEEGMYFVTDFWGTDYPINLELREFLPNSYFLSPELDVSIIGYQPFNGSIIYNLWKVGRTEMLMSEGIHSDFHDTGYGIGGFLRSEKEYDFGDKVPPTYLLPKDFIDYHSDLQGSIYNWGYFDISLINDIGLKEHQRLDLKNKIESRQKMFEDYGHQWSEDGLYSHHEELERLKKELDSLE